MSRASLCECISNAHALLERVFKEDGSLDEDSCVIAGGFLRDLICDKPSKDVDIFVSSHTQPYQVENILKAFGASVLEVDTFFVAPYRDWANGEVNSLTTAPIPERLRSLWNGAETVQVVSLTTEPGRAFVANVLDRFDLTCNQFALGYSSVHGAAEVYSYPAAEKAIMDRVFRPTPGRKDQDWERIERRIQGFLEGRYSDWTRA